MEKRSRRRTRDLATQPASQGLSENEIGWVRISMMAKSMNALFTGRIQKRKTNPLRHSHLACNTRSCLLRPCAVKRRRFPVGASPARQPLQPEAIGAVMEVTKWLKPSISVSRNTVTARVCRP